MKDYNNESTDKIKDEVRAMKDDIEKLVGRLSNIKDESSELMHEQLDNLYSAVSNLKNKAVNKGRDYTADLYSSTRQNPMRNLGYAFGAGFLLAFIISR